MARAGTAAKESGGGRTSDEATFAVILIRQSSLDRSAVIRARVVLRDVGFFQ